MRPLLPGALPPRGPPKAGGEGPNKGVSKLQLLICGNDFIRVLKGRVDRRDEEIGKLRGEVRRLREATRGMGGMGLSEQEEDGGGGHGFMLDGEDGEGYVDLERDLDAVEVLSEGLTAGAGFGAEEDGEEDGDD